MPLYGLEELSCPEEAKIDLVFIHGLFGDRRLTWTKNTVLWPQALLPSDLPDAHILSFGYDAGVVDMGTEISQGTIESHAADIAQRLAGLRAKTENSKRPVVFVAHSLGGLVCAQLVVNAVSGSPSDDATTLVDSVRGAVFLGTPFYGSPAAPWGELLRTMASAFYDTSHQKLKDLRESSEKLNILAETFARTLLQRANTQKQISVFFFNETKNYRGVRVVPEQNARVPGYGDHASINANHIDMCKFENRDVEGYESVVAAIRKVSQETPISQQEPAGTSTLNNYGPVKNQAVTQTIYGGMTFN